VLDTVPYVSVLILINSPIPLDIIKSYFTLSPILTFFLAKKYFWVNIR